MTPSAIDKFPFSIRPTSESSIGIEVFHSGIRRGRKHVFFFERYSGTLDYDPEVPESSSATLIIEAQSLACRDQDLSAKKRRELASRIKSEMLAASKFPEIVFSSTRIRKTAKHRFDFEGALRLGGKSQPMRADVAAIIARERIEIDATARVRLSDYGLHPPRSFFGLVGTKDEVIVRCLLWPERSS
jgi:polyisoprenoid-binding protein YceI